MSETSSCALPSPVSTSGSGFKAATLAFGVLTPLEEGDSGMVEDVGVARFAEAEADVELFDPCESTRLSSCPRADDVGVASSDDKSTSRGEVVTAPLIGT